MLLTDQPYLPDLTNVVDVHGLSCELEGQSLLGCYNTPPDSVASTDSPSVMQVEATVIDQLQNNTNFDCSSIIAPNPAPLPPVLPHFQNLVTPSGPSTELPQSTDHGVSSSSVPTARCPENPRIEPFSMPASHRPQVTSSRCGRAVIEIVNPREEYDKIQRKHGPKGKYSEQRIANGMV